MSVAYSHTVSMSNTVACSILCQGAGVLSSKRNVICSEEITVMQRETETQFARDTVSVYVRLFFHVLPYTLTVCLICTTLKQRHVGSMGVHLQYACVVVLSTDFEPSRALPLLLFRLGVMLTNLLHC